MKPLRCMALFVLAMVLTSCVDLKAVRDFASESARFSEDTELAVRFRDTYRREQPYASGQAAQLALANDQQRKAAYGDLLRLHRIVARYLRTLAVLAGDRTFDLSASLDDLATGIEAHPDFGLERKQVQAYANLAKVVTRWSTGARQGEAVQGLLQEGELPLQTLLEGMTTLVGYYRKTNENERKSVLGFLEIEFPFADTPQDRLLATLAKAHQQVKLQEYQLAEARYAAAEKGLRRIQGGHKALVDRAGRLSSEEARTMIERFTKDIQAIRENLRTVQSLGAAL